VQYFIYKGPSLCAKIFQKVLGGYFFESPGLLGQFRVLELLDLLELKKARALFLSLRCLHI